MRSSPSSCISPRALIQHHAGQFPAVGRGHGRALRPAAPWPERAQKGDETGGLGARQVRRRRHAGAGSPSLMTARLQLLIVARRDAGHDRRAELSARAFRPVTGCAACRKNLSPGPRVSVSEEYRDDRRELEGNDGNDKRQMVHRRTGPPPAPYCKPSNGSVAAGNRRGVSMKTRRSTGRDRSPLRQDLTSEEVPARLAARGASPAWHRTPTVLTGDGGIRLSSASSDAFSVLLSQGTPGRPERRSVQESRLRSTPPAAAMPRPCHRSSTGLRTNSRPRPSTTAAASRKRGYSSSSVSTGGGQIVLSAAGGR